MSESRKAFVRKVAVVMLAVVAGCGTNLAGGVSLGEARATCDAWDPAPGVFDLFVITAEAFRDGGGQEFVFLATWAETCDDDFGCVACGVQTAAAVWN